VSGQGHNQPTRVPDYGSELATLHWESVATDLKTRQLRRYSTRHPDHPGGSNTGVRVHRTKTWDPTMLLP